MSWGDLTLVGQLSLKFDVGLLFVEVYVCETKIFCMGELVLTIPQLRRRFQEADLRNRQLPTSQYLYYLLYAFVDRRVVVFCSRDLKFVWPASTSETPLRRGSWRIYKPLVCF